MMALEVIEQRDVHLLIDATLYRIMTGGDPEDSEIARSSREIMRAVLADDPSFPEIAITMINTIAHMLHHGVKFNEATIYNHSIDIGRSHFVSTRHAIKQCVNYIRTYHAHMITYISRDALSAIDIHN